MKQFGFGVVAALAVLLPLAGIAAPSETVLYRFQGGADGLGPVSRLLMDKTGALYGTTEGGGNSGSFDSGDGTVFKLTPPAVGTGAWSHTVIYTFEGGNDGIGPRGDLIADNTGTLYGTTTFGGQGCIIKSANDGCGSVFKLVPQPGAVAWTETRLATFQGKNGAYPEAGVVMGKFGNLYGTTEGGEWCGAKTGDGCGEVFALTPPGNGSSSWSARKLARFLDGPDGLAPEAGLVGDSSGAFYGTAEDGGRGAGSAGLGIVFKLAPPTAAGAGWTETVLHAFQGGNDGRTPFFAMLAIDKSGNLYGTTEQGGSGPCFDGCGTVFEVMPPASGQTAWTEEVLHPFQGGTDGIAPEVGVILGPRGALYSTTPDLCTASGCVYGSIFKLTPSAGSPAGWTKTVLYTFKGGSDGDAPGALTEDANGNFYGATGAGGSGGCSGRGCGTVFKVVP